MTKVTKQQLDNALYNQELEKGGDAAKLRDLEFKVSASTQDIIEIENKIAHNQVVISEQKKAIQELNWEIEKMATQKEVDLVKLSTQTIILKKHRKETEVLTEEVVRNRDAIEKKYSQLQNITEQMNLLSDKHSEKSKIKNEQERQLRAIKDQIASTVVKVNEQKAQIQNLEEENILMSGQLEQTNDQMQVISSNLEQLRNRSLHVSSENRSLREHLDKNKQGLSNLQREKENYEQRLAILAHEIENYQVDVEAAQSKKKELEKNIMVQMRLIEARNTRIKEQNVLYDQLMSNVSTLETTRENNLRTLKNHSQELQESEKHALDKKELVKSLRHENSILEENISTNKRAIEEHNALIQTLDLQQRELNAKVTKLAGQLIIENAKLEQLRENYNQANDYYETCQNQLTDSQKTLNNKQTARNELENALRTVTESIKTLELQIASTVRSVGETENIVNDLSQNLSEKEGQEKEKSNLLNLQENHLRDLQKEAKEFEERLELQNKRSVLQSSQIEERHQLIAEFENGVIDTKARLSALKDKFVQDSTRLQTLDKEIYQIMAQYKVTEQNLKELDSVTTFNLKQLSGQIPAQKQTLSTIKENVAYMLTEISHKNEKIALAENEIGALQSFIFDKSKESQISHDKLEASNPRIVELRKTLQEYKAQSIEIASKTHELEIAVNNKINEENELSQQIEMKKIKVEETQNMMANIESELFLAKTKNAQKSNELEELKTQENLNSRTVQKNIMHLKELQSDNEMLEQLIAEYSEKITTSDLSLATKHLEYERLTNLNKTLLNKITHLENTLSSPASAYSQKSFDRLNQEIAANQNKVAQLSETVSPASEQKLHFEQVMSEIDPNVTDAMKARLEGRFFGLSIATPKALSAKELTLSEHALETVAMDFETYFGENLEILGSVLSENGDLKIVLGATNIPPHMSVDEVKTKVSTTLKRLSDDHVNAAHIRVRLKVNKAQSPERISIDITYPGQITNRVQSPTT